MKIKELIPFVGISSASVETYDNPYFILYQYIVMMIVACSIFYLLCNWLQ